ncbi:MAG: spermidine/putrescine ABC transporter substrate-binding protein [Bdellovibrionaceae bacterium]|nr:spermidine/putrescine ABC transporter substrate-binding protein [Pseudobdellovibrionaceae bacterium]
MSSPTWGTRTALKKIVLCLGFGLFFPALVSCTRNDSNSAKQVNLAIWGSYLHPDTLAKFTKETGLKINLTHYSSNEELLAKIQSGASGLDVAVPSDYMVTILTKMKLLEPLDKSKVSHVADLLPEHLKQDFDPENAYSLPYAATVTGIAVHRGLFDGKISGWKDLLENPAVNGKLALLDDAREVAAAALKLRGQSLNTTDLVALEQARLDLLKIRPRVKMFTSDSIDILKNQEVAIAQAYSADIMQAMVAEPKIEFVIPQEGTSKAIDNLVIVKGAKNIEGAHRLIDFLLSPDIYLELIKTIRARPVLKGIQDRLPDELKNHPALFPSKDQMKNLESIRDLGEKNRLYEDLWTQMKTGP